MEPGTYGQDASPNAQHNLEPQQMEVIEMTTGSSDWLTEEFKRAGEALDCLPAWAQPVVTRSTLKQPEGEYLAPTDPGRASTASESPSDHPR